MQNYRLPDPGEGLQEAEIIAWKVAVGDTVRVNDIVVEIETSKSLVELPIPWAGVVTAIMVEEGQTVAVGTPIITIDDGSGAPSEPDIKGETASEDESGPMLVGYGAKGSSGSRRPRRGKPAGESGHEVNQQMAEAYRQTEPSRRPDDVQPAHEVKAEAHGDPLPKPGEAPRGTDLVLVGGAGPAMAKPPVRLLAKMLGIDLNDVTPTGPNGTITRADVEAAAGFARLGSMPGGRQQSSGNGHVQDEQHFTAHDHGFSHGGAPRGGERRVPMKGVRKVTAEAMVDSVTRHVHVTEWITVDVSATMKMVDQLKERREFASLRVSPLLVYAKAACLAMSNNPDINSSFDEETDEIVYHEDVNLGIAAATPRGLMVPNLKGAQRMSMLELCEAINTLVQISKEGRLQPADYNGGTFTITNVGVFGIDSGTPIINGSESAILCMGSIERRPWVVGHGEDERIEPRWVTTISISFDHKLIDGEQGSRFLHEVASILHNPELALLY